MSFMIWRELSSPRQENTAFETRESMEVFNSPYFNHFPLETSIYELSIEYSEWFIRLMYNIQQTTIGILGLEHQEICHKLFFT